MPQITINEFDFTGTPAPFKAVHTVFIPGLIGQGASETVASGRTAFVLCSSKSEFESHFGSKYPKGSTDDEGAKSWIMAHQLVQLGIPVLYCGVSDSSIVRTDPTIWEDLKDRALYDVRFITAGAHEFGLADIIPSTESGESGDVFSLAWAMTDAAYQRGDAIALFSPSSEYYTKVENLKGFASLFGGFTFTKVDMFDEIVETGQEGLKYASMFAPACSFPFIASKEGWEGSDYTANTKELMLPGIFTYLSAYAKAVSKYATWFAAAGSFRGISPFKFIPAVDYGDAAINTLQTRKENDICVNTIAEIRPFGNIVWGNRTMLPNVSEDVAEGGLKASHFLNVRHLCCELKKLLYRTSRKWTFEQNDDILWANYTADIKPLLDQMKSGRGIRGYRIIKIATNKKALLKAKIRIKPIEAVEDFYIDVELTDNLDVTVEVE